MYSCLNGNTRKEIYYKSMFCRKWFSILLVFQYGHTSRTCFCSLISVLILSPTSSDLVIRSQETVISFCRRILMKPFLSSSFNDLYCHLYRMRNVKCTSIKYIFLQLSRCILMKYYDDFKENQFELNMYIIQLWLTLSPS